ncbi:MAG: LacI family transcriptional regulator [Bacillus sp. (in: Bacteria)]|nr:LacI family transcriptional regulator [Bacillus sp. (in: firmicutes)]MCM1427216.1 LacI family transcriptional regulator [Eubacterium sp.]
MAEITIKDIAKQCGVGVSTVSRAINNHPDINPKTRRMIMDVIAQTGFIPNNSARNLKRTDAKCIAVLVKGIANPFFGSMIQIIEEEAQKNKYALVLRHVEAYEDEVDVALALVKEQRLRGIIFLGGAFYHAEEKLAKLTVPFVFSTIGAKASEAADGISYSNIAVDDRVESQKMTEYLLQLGHRRIAIITEGSEKPSVGQLRLEGYKDALKEHYLTIDDGLIWYVQEDIEHYSMENGYLTTKRMLDSGTEVTAVYATADLLAVGACRAILEAGKRIPEDISVAGYDGISLGEYYNPKLTTMKQPAEDMAKKTIQLLLDVIDGKKEHQQIIFDAKLVERESAKKLRVP